MLDVSRHFFTKEEVKQLLDAMALHKLNTFHWHLVDDNGWRIEIKKYPKLTEVGAWRGGVGFGLPTQFDDGLRPGRTLRRILHAGRHPRSRGLCGRSCTSPSCRKSKCPAIRSRRWRRILNLAPATGRSSCRSKAASIRAFIRRPKKETFQFLDDVLTEVFAIVSRQIHPHRRRRSAERTRGKMTRRARL